MPFYNFLFYLIQGKAFTSADATRIAAGIVTGIDFIGAGSIIATKGHVRGLTTAAAIIVFIALRVGEIEKKVIK